MARPDAICKDSTMNHPVSLNIPHFVIKPETS